MVVAFWNHQFTHVPMAPAVPHRKRVDPEGALRIYFLAPTGQPRGTST